MVIDSANCRKLPEHCTGRDGKLSPLLIDRVLIRFAHAGKVVRGMPAGPSPGQGLRGTQPDPGSEYGRKYDGKYYEMKHLTEGQDLL